MSELKLSTRPSFSIKVERYSVDSDPSIDIFQITLERNEAIWSETVPTEENLKWLIRGMRMMSPVGLLPEFEIPRRATSKFVLENSKDE